MSAAFTGGAFIGADWGTSRLRLFLCDARGTVLAKAEGPGIAEAGSRAAEIFAGLTKDWEGALPAVLSGMVGSTIGWREASYLPCPVAADAIGEHALRFESGGRPTAIVPGLSCINPGGLFDVLRGEETQLLGALQENPGAGCRLFCLPGTHAKWALVDGGLVRHFQTALSGELFALLSQHSVLARGALPASAAHAAFRDGALAGRKGAGLLHLLFSTRSRQLNGEIAREEAASYLSGLIIGAEVAAALSLFGPQKQVTLICGPALATLYQAVLAGHGLDAPVVDGDAAVLAGLTLIHARLFGASP